MHGPPCVFWANLTPFSLKANAEASATKAMGDANAAAKTATGLAETDFLKNKAEAYKGFGEAYLVQTIVEQLPAIAECVPFLPSSTQRWPYSIALPIQPPYDSQRSRSAGASQRRWHRRRRWYLSRRTAKPAATSPTTWHA